MAGKEPDIMTQPVTYQRPDGPKEHDIMTQLYPGGGRAWNCAETGIRHYPGI
jgi:hypothetical protein